MIILIKLLELKNNFINEFYIILHIFFNNKKIIFIL